MTTAITPIQNFESMLSKMEFKDILPSHISDAKFKQVVITALQKAPNLLSLNRASLFNACKECAQDGLLPDGREAALVPFKGMVKYMPMVQGVTKKARNSGEIATMDALVVYENDEYDSWIDEHGAHFKHRKCRGKRGNPILTYAYAITKDGNFYFEEIDEEQMQAIQECSKGINTPWNSKFKDEMKRKSALRRLCKYRLPSSSDIDLVIHRDDEFYDLDKKNEAGKDKTTVDVEPIKTDVEPVKKSKLEEAVVEAEEPETPIHSEDVKPGSENIPDHISNAEFTDKNLFVTGIVKSVREKSGETNGKAWTKYGININDIYYGTFSKSFKKIALLSSRDNVEIEIEYETAEINNVIFKNIIQLKLKNQSTSQKFIDDEPPI